MSPSISRESPAGSARSGEASPQLIPDPDPRRLGAAEAAATLVALGSDRRPRRIPPQLRADLRPEAADALRDVELA